MESTAKIKFLRGTARKARLVVDAVRGKMVSEALSLLELSIQKDVAKDVAKLLKSAVANLQSTHADAAIDVDDLRIKEIWVDGGPSMKRFRPAAHGRAAPVLKRMCHISVTIAN
ncbi:MAG: 50S ribosomal protein L22 [Chitinispirillaceae bacterium]|nr:50S ribosomal protein L22 [Chitinispirillaceae bacterium]